MSDEQHPGADIEACIATLERIVEDRGLLAEVDEETRQRLVKAAGLVSRPDRAALRKMAKAFRRKERDERRRADDEVLDATGIRTLRRAPVFVTPPALLPGSAPEAAPVQRELRDARKCYVCKAEFTRVHAFYDQMCEPCAELNWQKRNQSADLRGRVALVTGARVKIGYHAAIKLLRAGAHVVVTTRFPRDAAARYTREEDFEQWRDRLEVHGLDLRHTPSVEAFCARMLETLPRLDFILNNACQTVRRPAGFYRHLMELEGAGHDAVSAPARALLASWEEHRKARHETLVKERSELARDVGLVDPAALSQLELLPEDRGQDLALFPAARLDADLQQVDLRGRNSWRLTLAEVSSVELLEVQLVNAVAPFVLNARLKPLMMRVPTRDKHVVNVSAMEGQFYRDHKTDKHPHTNMAKAALNMMTRTSAADYVKDGIHMNSVDTGWITDEDPLEIAAKKVEEHGFHPPLDVVDGAARIVAPIFDGLISGEHVWGLFLKDYKPIPW
ncbi:SDR family NAD(P)-dependent oxidoreductase [Sandaracinus amylolyticus]|uniref:L-fuco-beta-pyranose dehydrogenase n=1 Tax=Sandaracinus amylolyticus TaxID=927083 RepID=A0A0F6W8G4_9BACT|nr:SDR family oxidoreductase [Sandaracinus amylolyticus]AKF09983.1 L-fuco-beta-pyranose dehydrogenase [Sandaracinus amylolyticus]